jgi:hypothetical protein
MPIPDDFRGASPNILPSLEALEAERGRLWRHSVQEALLRSRGRWLLPQNETPIMRRDYTHTGFWRRQEAHCPPPPQPGYLSSRLLRNCTTWGIDFPLGRKVSVT